MSAGDEAVQFERADEHVGIITLNRSAARNAITVDMAREIERLVALVESDTALRVGVIAAEGTVFCAGADLKEVAAGRGPDLILPGSGFAGFVYAAKAKPWIAAVQGPAYGGGMEISLACDMIVAGESATFALTEVSHGLIGGAGGCIRIARALPRALALELVTTAGLLDSARAYALGLVNRRVADDRVRAAAVEMAQAIARNSPLAVRESLTLTRAAADVDEERLLALQSEVVRRVVAGPDLIEGATAFVERRAPRWLT